MEVQFLQKSSTRSMPPLPGVTSATLSGAFCTASPANGSVCPDEDNITTKVLSLNSRPSIMHAGHERVGAGFFTLGNEGVNTPRILQRSDCDEVTRECHRDKFCVGKEERKLSLGEQQFLYYGASENLDSNNSPNKLSMPLRESMVPSEGGSPGRYSCESFIFSPSGDTEASVLRGPQDGNERFLSDHPRLTRHHVVAPVDLSINFAFTKAEADQVTSRSTSPRISPVAYTSDITKLENMGKSDAPNTTYMLRNSQSTPQKNRISVGHKFESATNQSVASSRVSPTSASLQASKTFPRPALSTSWFIPPDGSCMNCSGASAVSSFVAASSHLNQFSKKGSHSVNKSNPSYTSNPLKKSSYNEVLMNKNSTKGREKMCAKSSGINSATTEAPLNDKNVTEISKSAQSSATHCADVASALVANYGKSNLNILDRLLLVAFLKKLLDMENACLEPNLCNYLQQDSIQGLVQREGHLTWSCSITPRIAAYRKFGLINHNNICYLNAVIQALLPVSPLWDLALLPFGLFDCKSRPFWSSMLKLAVTVFTPIGAGRIPMDGTSKASTLHCDTYPPDIPSSVSLSTASSADSTILRTNSTRAIDLFEHLMPIAEKWLELHGDLKFGDPQDASEFLGFLLNSLADECKWQRYIVEANGLRYQDDSFVKIGRKNRQVKDSSHGYDMDSPIYRIFGGVIRTVNRGKRGETLSRGVEPFLILDIPLNDADKSLEALFERFFCEEFLTPKASYVGSKPYGQNPSVAGNIRSRESYLERLPPVLIICLKRFYYDNRTASVKKVSRQIQFSNTLKIKPNWLMSTGLNQRSPQTLTDEKNSGIDDSNVMMSSAAAFPAIQPSHKRSDYSLWRNSAVPIPSSNVLQPSFEEPATNFDPAFQYNSSNLTKIPGVISEGSFLGGAHDVVYDLVSVICHSGNSVEAGHYTSAVRSEDPMWCVCNDEIIVMRRFREVQSIPGAYIFVYINQKHTVSLIPGEK